MMKRSQVVTFAVFALALLSALGPTAGRSAMAQCPGDVVPTGNVNAVDLGEMLATWGPCGGCPADINGSGSVDGADLGVLLTAWGPCPPVVTAVTPTSGSTLGGTSVTINGQYFSSFAQVRFGGLPAISVQYVSATQLVAIAPPSSAGWVDVTVTTTGVAVRPNAFNYVSPAITSVSPTFGSTSGGTLVLISGVFLNGTTSVLFGGTPAASFEQISATQVIATVPSAKFGSVPVQITSDAGSLLAPQNFTFVSMVTPPWATVLESAPDPAIVTSPTLRQAIQATGLPWRVRDVASQVEFVLIPPGSFIMGCSASLSGACNSDESPPHLVTLTNPFYLGRFEVTQAEWVRRMGSNPSLYQGASYPDWAQRPVEQVSWDTVMNFLSPQGLRLPTEAEWEFAYRAGTSTAFHGFQGYVDGSNNDDLLGNIAWFSAGGSTRAVGLKFPNGFGLYDMSGNVSEWVNDRYSSTYYASSPRVNPSGHATIYNRVIRGGEFTDGPADCRASNRDQAFPSSSFSRWGFRAARNP
jgi:formylglycine-generating enzyme required for sulfatase activity